MDLAHLHLLLNHVPFLGALFAAIVLAWGLLRKNDSFKRFGMATLVISALIAIPTYYTGEPAEERIEKSPGVEKAYISAHEEAAEFGVVVICVAGIIGLAALLLARRAPSRLNLLSIISLLAALIAFATVARVANMGGQIRHPELRTGAPLAAPAADND